MCSFISGWSRVTLCSLMWWLASHLLLCGLPPAVVIPMDRWAEEEEEEQTLKNADWFAVTFMSHVICFSCALAGGRIWICFMQCVGTNWLGEEAIRPLSMFLDDWGRDLATTALHLLAKPATDATLQHLVICLAVLEQFLWNDAVRHTVSILPDFTGDWRLFCFIVVRYFLRETLHKCAIKIIIMIGVCGVYVKQLWCGEGIE